VARQRTVLQPEIRRGENAAIWFVPLGYVAMMDGRRTSASWVGGGGQKKITCREGVRRVVRWHGGIEDFQLSSCFRVPSIQGRKTPKAEEDTGLPAMMHYKPRRTPLFHTPRYIAGGADPPVSVAGNLDTDNNSPLSTGHATQKPGRSRGND
jgi:hypothetical protein